jgi:protocatechuate 3,4-dioxygenase beta subunit
LTAVDVPLSRRRLLALGLAALPAGLVLSACSHDRDDDQVAPPAATPECVDPADATEPHVVGPFFSPDSPERTSLLEDALDGERVVLSGLVLNTACQPVAGAVLDFWQCDGEGVYDEGGSRLRGRQRTGADGRYRLETIKPGSYDTRAPHIHVKVGPAGDPERLTTQLFFPGEALNESDFLFKPSLVVGREGTGPASFDFVIKDA